MIKNYAGGFLFVLFLALVSISPALAQKEGSKDANKDFEQEQYFSAIQRLRKDYSKTKDKSEKAAIAFKIAEAMRLNRQFNTAEGWYNKAISMGYSDPVVYYQLGDILKMAEKYEEALVEFERYAKEAPSDPRGDEQIKVVKEVIAFKKNPRTRFVVESFKQTNSAANDFSPVIIKEGLVFSSDREESTGKDKFGRTGGNYSDIFLLGKQKTGRGKNQVEKWVTPPVLLDEDVVNSKVNEGTATFDDKGNVIYFTRCNPARTEGDTAGAKQLPNCVIMTAKKRGKDWGDVQVMPFCNDTSIDYGHPALSPDGTKLIFSMDDPRGQGKHDLYLVTYVKRSRTWSDPINLGEVINTEGEEMFPYFFNDTTLYFSSDGHIGYGGLDVFVSYGTGETWTKPKNLNFPLNSGGDDFSIVFNDDKETGFFTSNRIKSRADDIYSFRLTPMVFTLSGIVRDKDTKKPIPGAKVTLKDITGNITKEAVTDGTGAYFFKLDHNHDYSVSADKEKYFGSADYEQSTVGLEFSADLTQDLTLNRSGFELPNVYYDLDSDKLRPESKPALDSLYGVLVDYPTLIVELQSHTDCRASMEYNQDLSQRRAQSVVNYMLEKGIVIDRMVPKGYGETQLRNHCACEPETTGGPNAGPGLNCNEEEHQINRRTEVKVVSFDYKPR